MAKSPAKQAITDVTRIIGVEAGKLPPQAVDMEEYILGAIMLEKDAIFEVIEFLKPDCFYKEAHAKIFQAAVDLSSREEPIDLNTVTHELRKKEVLEETGGTYYLAQLTNKVMSAANIEYNARIVHQKYIQRELIRIATEIQKKSFDEAADVDELLNTAEQSIFDISQGNLKKDAQPINALLQKAIDTIAKIPTGALLGIPSGFTELDRMTSGWQPTDLVIVAARPAMGKTAFALSMARNMAVEHNCGVALFSLEMSAIQLAIRLLSAETGLDMEKIRNGKLEKEEWDILYGKITSLQEAPLFIDDTPAISVFEFRAKCRRLVQQHHIKAAMVDYLQLMTWTGDTKGNREQEVSNISRSLKAIAKELDIPVIALAQVKREAASADRQGHKRPQLQDLRESGAIEQDADIVAFIHRPEYYGFIEDEDGNSLRGIAEIIIGKHRNGATGTVLLKFQPQIVKFTELDEIIGSSETITIPSKFNNEEVVDISNIKMLENAKPAFPSPEMRADRGDAPF
ncbi:MAG: replicative DNA helicase [Bacteroidales bacterium]|jgi:replicative DNA helicase|nr:replicative DNA helicase [Bacteroidales bacterium]